MVLKKVVGNDVVKGKENAEDGEGMDDEGIAGQHDPAAAIGGVCFFGGRCADIAKGAEERGNKRKDDKKMTQLPGSELLAYKLCVQV